MPLSALLAALVTCAPAVSAADAPRIPAAHLPAAQQGLQPLPGRCAGQAGPDLPPEGGTPVNPADPGLASWASYWRLTGVHPDASGKRLLDARGRPVTREGLAWLAAPVDLSRRLLPSNLWTGLALQGYRLDEATCRLIAPSGRPVTRADMEMIAAENRLSLEREALENVREVLRGAESGRPVPAQALARIKALDAAGVRLPADVRTLLDGGRVPTAAALSAGVEAAYARSTRFFDGQSTLKGLGEAALPVVPGFNAPTAPPAYHGSEEQRLGELLSGDLRKIFDGNPVSRELMDHFRDAKGAIHLPPMLVLKLTQSPDDPNQPGAVENPENGSLTLNHWEVERYLLAQLPPEQRAGAAKRFVDPAALRVFLETHPKERAAVLDRVDEVVFHEMVHSWQTRRSGFDIEMRRGNIADANPLEKEFEAHREQCRYLLTKSLRDPGALARSGYSDHCLDMVSGYRGFRRGIRDMYMRSFAGSQMLDDVADRQAQRESMARRLMGESLYQDARQLLKLVGMSRGDGELSRFRRDMAARERDFATRTLPALQRDLAALPARADAGGRPGVGLRVYEALPDADRARAGDALGARLLSDALARLIAPPPGSTLNERLPVFNAAAAELKREGRGWPHPLVAAYDRDAATVVESELDRADSAVDPRARAAALASARSWLGSIAPDAPGRATLAARLAREMP